MRRFFTYFLIVTYLFSFAEIREMSKLPVVFEHYLSHKMRDSSTTFFSFLKMHYLEDHGVDDDYAQDLRLPFKSHDFYGSAPTIVFPPKRIEFNFEHQSIPIEEQHNFAYSENFYPSVLQKIWQPPKI